MYRGAPHSGLPIGTRVTIDGRQGHYAGLTLHPWRPIEHVVYFDGEGN